MTPLLSKEGGQSETLKKKVGAQKGDTEVTVEKKAAPGVPDAPAPWVTDAPAPGVTAATAPIAVSAPGVKMATELKAVPCPAAAALSWL